MSQERAGLSVKSERLVDTRAAAPASCPYVTSAESSLMLAGANRPLAGIVVLDFGQVYQGPYATLLMAKAGADVIKIEPPQGEPLRRRAPPGKSTTFPIAMLTASCATPRSSAVRTSLPAPIAASAAASTPTSPGPSCAPSSLSTLARVLENPQPFPGS